MLKGNETVKALNTICDQLIKLSTALSTLAEILPPFANIPINAAAIEMTGTLSALKGELINLKSKTNFLI